MTRSTSKRLVALALSAAALTIAVPVAPAQSPDAFMRALNSQQQQQPTFVGSPDAIDRAIAAREAEKAYLALEARERALTERPTGTPTSGPDAFERALVTHADARTAQIASMLDRRERSLVSRPVSTPIVGTTPSRFDWSDFGMGAGAGVGLMLVLLGLGAGVLAQRRNDARVTTA
jgi:hypothetical protein